MELFRPSKRRSSPREGLTPEQQALADALQVRAERIRSESEDGLSIREATNLAAIQLGYDQ